MSSSSNPRVRAGATTTAHGDMSERDLQVLVRAMCTQLGLMVEHVEDSLRGRTWLPGWPDLTIVGHVIIYRELKAEAGKLSPEQEAVGAAIRRAGGDWAVWRPADLHNGTIARTLAGMRGPQRRAGDPSAYSTPDDTGRASATPTPRPARRTGRLLVLDL